MKKSILKWSLITIASLVILVISFGYWFFSLIPPLDSNLKNTQPQNLSYLTNDLPQSRGKILAVVTSSDTGIEGFEEAGYELTELSRAYYVFQANGFDVDIASPKGGEPPAVVDNDDMGKYDYAFLNDSEAQGKVKNSIPLSRINSSEYSAIYFVGGKGAIFDFPQNQHIQNIVSVYHSEGKVIGAVCHGPAALINVTLEDGSHLLKNKRVCGFTNTEELFLIPDAATIFPFLLENKLKEAGATFEEGTMYLNQVVVDGNLVTGQNPWSTWEVAERMIEQMGYELKPRQITAQEYAVSILKVYESEDYQSAKQTVDAIYANGGKVDRVLLAVHSLVASMQFKIGKAVQLLRLTSYLKGIESA